MKNLVNIAFLTLSWMFLSSCVLSVPTSPRTEENCSAIVTSALEVTDRLCSPTSINQACYGHAHLDAAPQPGFESFRFSQAGDRIDVTGLQSLRLSPMDTAAGVWGVALMHVQANLPGAMPAQDVTFLVFGDVEIENQVNGTVPVVVSVAASGNVNVRQEPTLDSFVMGTLASGETVTARGRLEDSSWLYIDLPDSLSETNTAGWVYAPSMSSGADLETLSIVDPQTAHFGPMQAFYLQTGENDSTDCTAAPENGLMIQTSEGVAEVNLWINEVKIRLGSTAFITAQRNSDMTITMLEGTTHVEALGVEVTASAGSELTIPMNQDLAPAAPPNPPAPIEDSNLGNLPVTILERPIIVPTVIPSATPTWTPVPPTNTPRPTNTATATITRSPTPLPTNTPTLPPSLTPPPTDTPTLTPSLTPLPTDTPTLTPSLTPLPTDTPTPIPSATDTPLPTATDTPRPTATDTPEPTATSEPTETNTRVPTATATRTDVAESLALASPTATATTTSVPTP